MVPRLFQFLGLTLAISLVASSSAFADTVFFTDRAAWRLAGDGRRHDGDIRELSLEQRDWQPAGSERHSERSDVRRSKTTNSSATTAMPLRMTTPKLRVNTWNGRTMLPTFLHVTLPVRATAIGFDYGQFYGSIQPFVVSLGQGEVLELHGRQRTGTPSPGQSLRTLSPASA